MGTWLTERFGLSVPVVSAPMAGAAAGRLAAAVSRAGALGMVGVGSAATPAWVLQECGIAASDGRPYGAGLQAWALPANTTPLDAVLAAAPALVSVSYGSYATYVATLHEAGITVATQVGTTDEARAAEQAGVDVVVARGAEGGGHGRNDVGTLPLLQSVLESVSLPVLAAGGIGTARGVAAVLAAGAAGAWVGTAFLTSAEADTTPAARDRLVAAKDTDTAYARVFDIAGGFAWPPEYGGRALRNGFLDRWAGREDELAIDGDAAEHYRSAHARRDYDTASLYAGQGVGLLHGERTAAEVVAELAGARELLRQAAGLF